MGSRIFITGSADGLGLAAAEVLQAERHQVVVHVRSAERAAAVKHLTERGASLVVGDLADAQQTRSVAEQVNQLGRMDAVIHNAGVYSSPQVAAVNVVAPYLLTALMQRPRRLIYLSSSMHLGGQPDLALLENGLTYSDSKLFVTALTLAVARCWPDVWSNAVDPGWVPTKMGGAGATDDLRQGHLTQEWLATSEEEPARVSGGYWYHQQPREPHAACRDVAFQDGLLAALGRSTGVPFPVGPAENS